MATYSFMDVTATLSGPEGFVDLGYGAAVAEEGITISLAGDRDVMTVGADGEVMHSLRADKSGQIVVRLLATSPANAALQAMYDAQAISPSNWGKNVMTIVNKGNDESTVARSVAFTKQPDRSYVGGNGGTVEWAFNCGKIDTITGVYS